MSKYLMIIGNGFDLICLCKTSYFDYFNYLEEADNFFTYYMLQNRISKKNWSNIEEQIKNILEESYISSFVKEIKNSDKLIYNDYIIPYINNHECNTKSFTSFFKTEINKLENSFRNYLNVIENDVDLKKGENLLQNIVINSESLYVLNFNYTDVLKKVLSNLKIENTINHVHGSKNPIFGIDYFVLKKSKKNLKRFTKTYRKMEQKSISSGLPLFVDEIIFYGHSLSSFDYSYFQSIFDFYDLYNSKIVLHFSARKSNQKRSLELISRELFDAVEKLLSDYGETLENINRGNNLLHKLILENRIVLDVEE